MSDLLTQVVAMIIGTILLAWFGFGSGHKTITIITSSRQPKKWKLVVVVGIAMIICGLIIFSNNYPMGGFKNPYSGAGFSLSFIGFLTYFTGKFGLWWNK